VKYKKTEEDRHEYLLILKERDKERKSNRNLCRETNTDIETDIETKINTRIHLQTRPNGTKFTAKFC
jgi:hypothetical protein